MAGLWHVGTSDDWYVHPVGRHLFAKPEPGEPMSREDAEKLAQRWKESGYLPFFVTEEEAMVREIMER